MRRKIYKIYFKHGSPISVPEGVWNKARPLYDAYLAGTSRASVVKLEDSYFDLSEIKIVQPTYEDYYPETIAPERQLETSHDDLSEDRWIEIWSRIFIKTGDMSILHNKIPQQQWEKLIHDRATTTKK